MGGGKLMLKTSKKSLRLADELGIMLDEFNRITKKTSPPLKKALKKVIFNGDTYESTGFKKQAIYSGLKMLQRKMKS